MALNMEFRKTPKNTNFAQICLLTIACRKRSKIQCCQNKSVIPIVRNGLNLTKKGDFRRISYVVFPSKI